MTFAQNLRAARVDAGLTAAQLARRSGLNDRTIRSLENGSVTMPSVRTAMGLCDGLGIDMVTLVGFGLRS